FTGPTAQVIMARRLAERARPLRVVRPTVPEASERALLKALERTPADRFADTASFVAALRAASAGPRRRISGRSIVLAGTLLVVLALAGWLTREFWPGAGKRPRDPEITALYERGMREYSKRTPTGAVAAIAAFNAAVARDSSYVEARTGLAKAYVFAYGRYFPIPGVPFESMPRLAVAAVDGALAVDRDNADVWLTHGLVNRIVDPTDYRGVIRSIRHSLELDSTSAHAWQWLGVTIADTGNLSEGLAAWRRSARANPTYTEALAFLALGHYWRQQYDSASIWADSAVAVDPTYLLGRTTAGYIAIERREYERATAAFEAAERLTSDVEVVNTRAGRALAAAAAGRRQEALDLLRDTQPLAAAYTTVPHTAVYVAQAFAVAGAADSALVWLSRIRPRANQHFQMHLRCDPPLNRLKGDPRFKALLSKPAPPPGRGC
ncbi:MAG: hypothetical protein ACREH4_16805, partial [Vitreimonas sp.]